MALEGDLPCGEQGDFADYLGPFESHGPLRDRVLRVLQALPDEVVADFVGDPRFSVEIDNYEPGKGSTVWMALPGAKGAGSRSVVLRPRLATSSEAFAVYVIAHEFAHAYLRNGAWQDISDPEEAADALAAHWGFPKPATWG